VEAGAELARKGVAAGRAVAGEALQLGDHQRLHARGRQGGARVVVALLGIGAELRRCRHGGEGDREGRQLSGQV